MTITPAAPAAPSRTREVLVLADGVELLGEYEDSGFREPPLLARRGDGQMIKLTRLLHCVAAACDGRRDAGQVAAVVSEHFGRGVSEGNVLQLAEKQLRPLGVLARADGTTPELPKRQALLSLRHRKPVLSGRVVNRVAAGFTWLHVRPVTAALLALLLLFDAWLFGIHGIAGGLRSVLYEPAWLLAVLLSVVVATAFHEIGHASACRYSGARPGEMGVGVYLIWPAFYCDVTEAYRLGRRGRLRTDLGGVYFNGLFALAAAAAYLATGHEALLFMVFVQHLIALQQLLPLMRFDGYYVLSDLTGVPDILSRIKPIFRSLVRGRRREPRVAELKPWVRVAVTAYLIVLVPALVLMIGSIVLSAPRTFATAYDSFGLQLDRLRASDGAAEMGVGAFRIAALVMPPAAMSLSLSRSIRMALCGIGRWSSGSAPRRIAAVAGAAAAVAATAFVWWPNGDYQPIRPGERGTIGEAIGSVPDIPSGRPSFTPAREQQFEATPTVRERAAAVREHREPTRHTVQPGGADVPGSTGETDLDGGAPAGEDPAGGSDAGTDPESSQDPAGTATPTPSDGTAPTGDTTPAPTTDPAPSSTQTPTDTATPTSTPTPTSTSTPSATPSPTPTGTPTASTTPTSTATPLSDGTATASPSPVPDTQALGSDPTSTPVP